VSEWVVALCVAGIAALATIMAAVVAAAKDRRDERTRILQDIEITKQIATESVSKKALQKYIDDRILMLTIEKQMSQFYREEAWQAAILFSAIAVTVASGITGNLSKPLAVMALVWAILIIQSFGYNRIKNRRITHSLRETRSQVT
jgi:Flp pilus assembly protein TadB